MPSQDAAGVCVGHKHRPLSRVERDGVNRFGTKTAEGQELASKFLSREREQPGERASVLAAEPVSELPNRSIFLPVKP